MKKILGIILAVAIIINSISLVGMTAFAATSGESSEIGVIINGDFEDAGGTTGFSNYRTVNFHVVEDPDNAQNHVLHISGSTEAGNGDVWQDVAVKPNTDYIWTFRMKDSNGQAAAHVIEVFGGESFTTRLMTSIMSSAGTTLGDQGSKGWYAKPHNGTDWVTITAKFNSGNNEKVRLNDNAWYQNRSTYIDDWQLVELTVGNIVNGDFENGLGGFTTDSKTTKFAVVNENGNNLLNVSGSSTAGNGAFWQDVSVKANTDYVLTFRMKDTSAAWAANFISVLGANDTDLVTKVTDTLGCTDLGYNTNAKGYTVKISTAGTWSTFNVYFSTGSNTTVRIKDNLFASSRNAYFDDFKLTEITVGNIVNGDFVNGLGGFTTDGKTTKFAIVNENGNNLLNVSGSSVAGNGAFWQDVPVEANSDYVLTFRMKDTSAAWAANFISVLGANDTDLVTKVTDTLGCTDLGYNTNAKGYTVKISTAGTWSTFNVYFSTGSNTLIRIKDNLFASSRNAYFDDFKLIKVTGSIINGDFENGLGGFVTDGKTKNFAIVNEDGNNVLNIKGGDTVGTGMFWQDVAVKADTDYKWTFRMKDSNGQGAAHIVSVLGGASFDTSLISNVISSAGDALTVAGAEYNGWFAKPHDGTNWVTITVRFNSGSNTIVRLKDNAFYNSRNSFIDDWDLTEIIPGTIVNGDFENGLDGFNTDGFGTIETVVDGDNNVLHISGANYGKGIISQDVEVKKNTEYVWTYRMKETNSVGNAHIVAVLGGNGFNTSLITNVKVDGVNDLTAATNNPNINYNGWFVKVAQLDTWQTVTVRFNSGDNTIIRVSDNAYADSRNTYIDDWAISELSLGVIENGDFEDGINGYVTDGNATKFETVVDPDNADNHVLNLSGSATPGSGAFWQDVPVEKNTYYLWTFRMKDIDESKIHLIAVYPGYTTNNALPVEATSQNGIGLIVNPENIVSNVRTKGIWDTFTVRFYSGDNTTVRLWHNAYYNTRDAYIDDWSLTVDENDTPIKETYIIVKGDASGDGLFDIRDLVALKKGLVGIREINIEAADLTGDNIVNASDLTEMRRVLLGVGRYVLVWSDDFDDDLDTNWSFGNDINSDVIELRSDETVANVDNGNLVLNAGVDNGNYYTAKALSTSDSMAFTYGYVEMRAKIPVGNPAFPAFWMKTSDLAKRPDSIGTSEIDIFEVIGNDTLISNVHKWYYKDIDGDGKADHDELNANDKSSYLLSGLNMNEYHTFGLRWTPEVLEFSIDGIVYMTLDISDDNTLSEQFGEDIDQFAHDPHYLIISNFLNIDKITDVNGNDYSNQYVVDYVKLYQMPGEGNLVLHK